MEQTINLNMHKLLEISIILEPKLEESSPTVILLVTFLGWLSDTLKD